MLLPTINGRPVLLPAHDDRELNQPIRHYHLDPRFHDGVKAEIIEDKGQGVVWMDFPEPEGKEMEFGISFYLQLLKQYEGCKLKGTKCPHKGVEVFHEGQCMGHGLRFDCDGKVIGRMAECQLRIEGTQEYSVKGKFDELTIRGKNVQVKGVELLYEGQVLARNNFGPYVATTGDRVKFSFFYNNEKVELDVVSEVRSVPEEDGASVN